MADNLPEKSEVAKREEAILKFWQENKIFEKTLAKKSPKGEFVFYEGPPTANGRPGIHHLEARAFKDAIPRYRTMRGYHVRRKGGWDTHGLPVELQVEKELGLKSKKEVETYGLAAFNQKCKESVWTYVREWEEFTNRMGYWVDLQNPYITYQSEYIESLWKIVKTIEGKGLLYKDYKVVPWCPRCETALSSHELAQGYQDVKDLAVTVKFKVNSTGERFSRVLGNNPQTAQKPFSGSVFLLAWTTTPWTLPGNVALAVNPSTNYVRIKANDTNENYILAKSRLEVLKDLKYEIVSEMLGKELAGLEYEPLYPFMPAGNDKAFKVYTADFVTTEEGTGIVHLAPMYGQNDFELGTKVGLPKRHLVNEDGTFKSETGFLAGKFVKDEAVAIEIIKDLAGRGLLFNKEKYEHSYPFCWRCKTPLIYFARDSWYIRMSALRDELVRENESIHWEPERIKEGRFGEWLREVKDWAISRERYWGTPLPVWLCDKCGAKKVVGTIAELKRESRNAYYLMRHGEAESNIRQIVSDDAPGQYHLTAKGKNEVVAAAKKLIKEKIDLIIVSPVLRTRETAELVARELGLAKDKIVFDERLREIGFGDLDGQSVAKYHIKPAANGEPLAAVRARAMQTLYELDTEYAGQKILLITHEAVACLMSGADSFLTGEMRPLDFRVLPHNENFELDLHRPYIDEVKFKCARQVGGQACGGEMSRVKEVMDVWFDSGSMPFAQGGDLYPADFISEAIDQTRGWFYTLHAVGILMGQGKAFRNVICLGHILDAEGKKMSKSLGNVVDPWTMMNKYGADALRFWMYSVNQPGESKNFDEKTVDEIGKKVFNLTNNVMSFYEMYADLKIGATNDSTNILDRWIISRLNQLAEKVTNNLDNYILLEPTRAIRDFIGDLSQWYLRRSRDRFKSENEVERREAVATLRYVLGELAKVMAPFTPFLAEQIFRVVKNSSDPESVHLCEWPPLRQIDEKILEEMTKTRETVSVGLELRAKAGIKIRQPLAVFTIAENLTPEFLELIKDELNVEEVKVGGALSLDTNLTPELKEKGEVRDLIREIQDWRKKQNLKPGEKVSVPVPQAKKILAEKFAAPIKAATAANDFNFVS
jgi:isoleucyl-tRNA synthetase